MLGMKFIVLLLVWTLALAQDIADIESELEEDPTEKPTKDSYLEAEKEADSHVTRLNATEKRVLEMAIANTSHEMERIATKALELDCPAPSPNGTLQDTMPAAISNEAADMDPCSALRTALLELKLRRNVFIGVKLVDDEVKIKEIPYLSKETRKRSLKRTAQLTFITEELEMGAKLLGKDTTGEKVPDRNKRASGACSYNSLFNYHHYEIARSLGKTIQVSAEEDIGVFLTATAETGYTYGPKGEFGCALSVCTGWRSNIGISVGITEGYYYNFNDVEGKSKVVIFSAGFLDLSFSYGVAKTVDTDRKIGYLTGVSFGSNWFFDVSALTCNTIMTKPQCPKIQISYKERYYTSCGLLGWRVCAKYRTVYRYGYNC